MTSDLPDMNEAQIKHMVDRFLAWRLPEHFYPDAGISFERRYSVGIEGWPEGRHEPTGTNLFNATQATAMVRYMLDGLPAAALPHLGGEPVAWRWNPSSWVYLEHRPLFVDDAQPLYAHPLPAAPVTPKNKDRHTFVVPKGHEAVFDSDGRATGETRPVTLGEGADRKAEGV